MKRQYAVGLLVLAAGAGLCLTPARSVLANKLVALQQGSQPVAFDKEAAVEQCNKKPYGYTGSNIDTLGALQEQCLKAVKQQELRADASKPAAQSVLQQAFLQNERYPAAEPTQEDLNQFYALSRQLGAKGDIATAIALNDTRLGQAVAKLNEKRGTPEEVAKTLKATVPTECVPLETRREALAKVAFAPAVKTKENNDVAQAQASLDLAKLDATTEAKTCAQKQQANFYKYRQETGGKGEG